MKLGTTANPVQIALMTRVLDAYCRQAGITSDIDRETIGAQIVELFGIGLSREDELLAALILPPAKGNASGHKSRGKPVEVLDHRHRRFVKRLRNPR